MAFLASWMTAVEVGRLEWGDQIDRLDRLRSLGVYSRATFANRSARHEFVGLWSFGRMPRTYHWSLDPVIGWRF